MEAIKVLDHGYVRLVEAYGTGDFGKEFDHPEHPSQLDLECGIIEAARQSTQKGFQGWDEDLKLLTFLFNNHHATPFEFAGMIIEVQAPIFVFREWHRHRSQSYNEMSARYAPLPNLYYQPDIENVKQRMVAALTDKNKQARSAFDGVQEQFELTACAWGDGVGYFYNAAEKMYKDGLSIGIPKELARVVMPVGHYSRMRANATLRNWLAFMTLRADPAAMWEIRQFAITLGDVIMSCFPKTWALFDQERHKAAFNKQQWFDMEARLQELEAENESLRGQIRDEGEVGAVPDAS